MWIPKWSSKDYFSSSIDKKRTNTKDGYECYEKMKIFLLHEKEGKKELELFTDFYCRMIEADKLL